MPTNARNIALPNRVNLQEKVDRLSENFTADLVPHKDSRFSGPETGPCNIVQASVTKLRFVCDCDRGIMIYWFLVERIISSGAVGAQFFGGPKAQIFRQRDNFSDKTNSSEPLIMSCFSRYLNSQ